MTAFGMARGAFASLIALTLTATAAFALEAPASKLPAPGSYVLHPILRTPEATLLDAQGKAAPLSVYTRGAVTALGFFYSRCADPLGCPLAWSSFEEARRKASADPLLKDRLRLVFISLDPARDTPSVLRMLQTEENDAAVPWVFLTGASEGELTPVLSVLGQDIAHERSGAINHMLKVFLIDPDGWVREIYSAAFLTPEALLNDARTLAITFPDARNEIKQ